MKSHILISGSVCDVGFRAFVKSNAKKLGLCGWVQNTRNGKVEGLFVGLKEKIEEIIALCKKGPFLAEVKDLRIKW